MISSRPQARTGIPIFMNPRQFSILSLFIGLWLVLLSTALTGRAAEETFPLLETKTGVYSNVTVTTKSKDYIVILHAGGLASLKVSELSPETHAALGFGPVKGSRLGGLTVTAKARELVATIPTKQIEAAWSKHLPAGIPELKLNSTFLFAALGVFVILHLLFSYCGSLICRKVEQPAGVLIWVPILQFIPLFRAAKMSPFWLVGMLVPGVNLIGHVLWSFRIAAARGRGIGTALLLILPTYPFAFMYLAFAGAGAPPPDSGPPKKVELSGMTFDQA